MMGNGEIYLSIYLGRTWTGYGVSILEVINNKPMEYSYNVKVFQKTAFITNIKDKRVPMW